jgi:hypothetical protein
VVRQRHPFAFHREVALGNKVTHLASQGFSTDTWLRRLDSGKK